MQVNSIQNLNYPQNSTSFKGLTKKLSRKMYIDGKKDIIEIINNRSVNQSTVVGKLPPILFQAIKEKDKGDKIREIIQIFTDVAEEIRNFRPTLDKTLSERQNKRPETAVNNLKKVFVDLNIIPEDANFDLVFLGEGNYKRAYKLEGVKDPRTGEELCYKVFHLVDKTPEWHKYKTHGNYAELNTAAYWMKTFGYNTQRGKFYFGDIYGGFFVDKFIDKSVAQPKKKVDAFDVGLKLTDEFDGDAGHNKIHGYSIDPGGPRIVNRVKNESEIARKIFNHIKSTPDELKEKEWTRLFLDIDNLDFKQKYAGLAISIKHLKHRSKYFRACLRMNEPYIDMGLAYVLKYQKSHNARKFFELLMKRKNPIVQTVLLNEIPLIAREKVKIDDLDVPRGEIKTDLLNEYYQISKHFVLPEAEEHLASYIHLLPKEKIMPEAERLIKKNKYEINDRILHKIKFVKDEEFSFNNKIEILKMLEKYNTHEYLNKKLNEVRIYVIRNQLDD